MIAIKKNGIVYFCESYCNSHYLSTTDDFIKYEENRHVIRDKNLPHRLIMCDAPLRAVDLIRYGGVFPKRLTPQNLLRQTYPSIVPLLGPYGFLNDDDACTFDFLFAKGDKCYAVRGGGVIDEVEEFYPFCYAKHAAIAEYMRSKDLPIMSLVWRIYTTIEKSTTRIQFPVVVMNTGNDEVTVIRREER